MFVFAVPLSPELFWATPQIGTPEGPTGVLLAVLARPARAAAIRLLRWPCDDRSHGELGAYIERPFYLKMSPLWGYSFPK